MTKLNSKQIFILCYQTVAHEIGHNLGFHHDHSKWHKEAGCNGKGIMSYGDHPFQWSECSKKDFKAYFNHATKVQGLTWCMEGMSTLNTKSGQVLLCSI